MKTAQLIKKDKFVSSYGITETAHYQPYYFGINGNEHFIMNLISGSNDPFHSDKRHRSEMAEKIYNLRKNNYRFICFCGGVFKNPFGLIRYVREKGYSFQRHGEFFKESNSGSFVDFHGNLVQISNAFHFRIYDKKMVAELKNEMKSVKTAIHY